MPLWLPPSTPGQYVANAGPITVTAGGTAHTKGTWTELVASTSRDVYWVCVGMHNVSASGQNSATLVDIGVGAAGSELVVIPDLNAGAASAERWAKSVYLPVCIPAGSRVSARAQSVAASKNVSVMLWLFGDPDGAVQRGSGVTAYGVDSANSRGTNTTASNAWVEITGSTTRAHSWWLLMMGQGGSTATSNSVRAVDLGFGASGAEQQIGRWESRENSSEAFVGPEPPIPIYRPLPAGTRIAGRTNTTPRDIIVYAV